MVVGKRLMVPLRTPMVWANLRHKTSLERPEFVPRAELRLAARGSASALPTPGLLFPLT